VDHHRQLRHCIGAIHGFSRGDHAIHATDNQEEQTQHVGEFRDEAIVSLLAKLITKALMS
jgi:hypothetical protein